MCIYAEICTHTLCAKKHFLVLLRFLICLVACMVLSSSDVSCQAASGHLNTDKGYKMKSRELSASLNLENHLSGQCRKQDTCTFMLSKASIYRQKRGFDWNFLTFRRFEPFPTFEALCERPQWKIWALKGPVEAPTHRLPVVIVTTIVFVCVFVFVFVCVFVHMFIWMWICTFLSDGHYLQTSVSACLQTARPNNLMGNE